MGKYIVNIDGAVMRDNEYLLIERGSDEEHAAGLLSLPGGKLENPPNEKNVVEKTIRREIAEEVDLEIGEVTYVHSNTFEMDTGAVCLNIVTACEYLGGEAQVKAEDEVADIHWLTYNEIQNNEFISAFTERFITLVETTDTA